jgi:hypothetical protein
VGKRSHLRASHEYRPGSNDIKEVSHRMGRDRSKVAAQKAKGKAGSRNQSGCEFSGVEGMFKSLHKVGKQLVKAQL